jgi:hypothetical protein
VGETMHTPEPWVYGGMVKSEAAQAHEAFSPWIENGGPRTTPVGKSVCIIDADMKRLVACVNACAGMTDPAAEITRLRDELAEALSAVQVFEYAAQLGLRLSMYAAASKLKNTSDFLGGLMEECEEVQNASRCASAIPLANALMKRWKGIETFLVPSTTDARSSGASAAEGGGGA